MKYLPLVTTVGQTRFCNFEARNLKNVNRSTDEQLLDDMAEKAEARLNTLRAAAPAGARLSLDILKDQIRPNLTVKTFYGSNLRLRDDTGRIIGKMANGSRVTFEGETKLSRDANGQHVDTDVPPDGSLVNRHLWFKVQSKGRVGWASAEYLQGSLNDIPVTPEPRPEPRPEPIPEPEPEPELELELELKPEPEPEPEPKPILSIDLSTPSLGDTLFYRAPAAAALERITDNNRAQSAVGEAVRVSREFERVNAENGRSGFRAANLNAPPNEVDRLARPIDLPFDEQVAKIAGDTQVPPDRVRAMLMDLSRWDENKILANPKGFQHIVEDLNARYGDEFAKFAPRAMDVAPALAFFKSRAIRPILGKYLPAIGGGLLWTRIIRSEGGDWTTLHAPDERWNTGNIAVDTGVYFVPIVGNFKDFNDAHLEWKEGSYGMAAISVTSGTIGMVLDGFSIATAWTGIGFAAGQGARMGVKTGTRALKAGIKYLAKDTTRSVWDVMTFKAFRPGSAGIDAATSTLRGSRAANTPEASGSTKYKNNDPLTPVVARPNIDTYRDDPGFQQSANNYLDTLRDGREYVPRTVEKSPENPNGQEGMSFMHEGAEFRLEKGADGNWQAIDSHGARLDIARAETIPTLRENAQQRALDFYDKNIMPKVQKMIDGMPKLFSQMRANIKVPKRFNKTAETVVKNLKDFEWNRFNLMGPKNRAEIARAHKEGEIEFKRVRTEQAEASLQQAKDKLAQRSGGIRGFFTRTKTKNRLAAKVKDTEAELARVRGTDAPSLVREYENFNWFKAQLNQLGHRVGEATFLNRGESKAEIANIKKLRKLNKELHQQEVNLTRLEARRDSLSAGVTRRGIITEINTLEGEIKAARTELNTEVEAMYSNLGKTENSQVINDRIIELKAMQAETTDINRQRTIRQEISALEHLRNQTANPRLNALKENITSGESIKIKTQNGINLKMEVIKIEPSSDGKALDIEVKDSKGKAVEYRLEESDTGFKAINKNDPSDILEIKSIEKITKAKRSPQAAEKLYNDLKVGSVIRFRDNPDFSITIKEIDNPTEGAVVRLEGERGRGTENIEVDFRRSRLLNHLENTNAYIE